MGLIRGVVAGILAGRFELRPAVRRRRGYPSVLRLLRRGLMRLLLWLGLLGLSWADTLQLRDGSIVLWVPPGTFTMGSDWSNLDQRPTHSVTLSGFWMGRHEVSNARFRRYLAESGSFCPPLWQELADRYGDDRPALGLSQVDALAYCAWAGLALPSEEQWEYAARGRSLERLFPWGRVFVPDRCWSSVAGPAEGPEPVDSRAGGASWVGCQHMSGNAWEWTDSWYQGYSKAQRRPEFGQKYKVLRGGHWQSQAPESLQTTARSWSLAVARLPQAGFRVVWPGPAPTHGATD